MNLSRVIASAVLAAAAMLAPAAWAAPAAGAAPATGPGQQSRTVDPVVVTVESVDPSTPLPTQTLKPLSVRLTLTNSTDKLIKGVRILGERGDPIGHQEVLDQALAASTPPATPGFEIKPTRPVTVDLPPQVPVDVTFTTTTGIPTDAGLCLCAQAAVYPLFFSAHVVGDTGVDQRLGVAATYVPSFYAAPAPERVSWIWPVLERPHRLLADTVFVDDQLAEQVGPVGRLTRVLDVVQQVGDKVPLTLVVDPELLDELEVMATQQYTVTSGTKTVAGTGKSVAAAWLDRFRGLLVNDSKLRVQLIPYADPDFESLTSHGLTWSSTMPATMRQRVQNALAGRDVDSTLAWPAGGAVSESTLARLAQSGVSTLVLSAAAVSAQTPAGTVPPGLARLQVGSTDIAAALTYPAIQNYVARSIVLGGTGQSGLPYLVAELAVRAAAEPTLEHAVAITPPRYVDPDVTASVQAIMQTSNSTFARPLGLAAAVSGPLLPTGRSRLAKVPASAIALPPGSLDAASLATRETPGISSMLDQSDPAARDYVNAVPAAVQRVESAAWRAGTPGLSGRGSTSPAEFAAGLVNSVDAVTSGVRIVRPSSGSYTLASGSSPLPITVNNDLPYRVQIRLRVSTVVNGLPGFSTQDIGIQRVDSHQKRTLNLPTKTVRSGRINVEAVLQTPNGLRLGDPVPLTVRSTALGAVGVVITIAAGVVLVLALFVRLIRRLRTRRPDGRDSMELVAHLTEVSP